MGNCDFWSSNDLEERRWIIDFIVLNLDFYDTPGLVFLNPILLVGQGLGEAEGGDA